MLLTEEERKARRREAARRWREANPEKHRESVRKCREKNREKYLEANRARRRQNLPKARQQMREWREKNPERWKELASQSRERNKRNITCRRLRQNYGITLDEYAALFEKQKGLCKICAQPESDTYRGKVKRLAVDHCHETGKIRGLLCQHCNTILGKANDDPDRLEAAAAYLRDHH